MQKIQNVILIKEAASHQNGKRLLAEPRSGSYRSTNT